MFSGLLSCHPGASCATLASWRTAAKRGCERWQPAKARRDSELAAGPIARRAGTRRTAENLKNPVRTLFGLFSTASEPEGPKNLTAYATLKLQGQNDDSKALPAPANRYPLN
jgi:hypothetical protein